MTRHPDWLKSLLLASLYPDDWQITLEEAETIYAQCVAGLCTTNGDTAPVTITARQLLLLLRAHVSSLPA